MSSYLKNAFIVIITAQVVALAQASVTEPQNGPTNDRERFPWPFVLQLDRDSPFKVEGRVVDSGEKPLENAHVAIIASFPRDMLNAIKPLVLGEAVTDPTGAFSLTTPSVPTYQCIRLTLAAYRSGSALQWTLLDTASRSHRADFQLEKEHPLRGIVKNKQGRPQSDVPISVRAITEADKGGGYRFFCDRFSPTVLPAAWPPTAITDKEGRFAIHGLQGGEANKSWVNLQVDDSRFAPQSFHVEASAEASDEITLEVSEARIVVGVVLCKDTRLPLANAWLKVATSNEDTTGDQQVYGVDVKTDDKGRFEASCRLGNFLTIYVYPPAELPYPAWVTRSVPWPAGVARHDVTVEVPRGILLRGRVVDGKSGQPVPGATVEYQVRTDVPNFDREFRDHIYWAAEYRQVIAGHDGRFKLGVVSGPGYLLVKAPTPDFVSTLTSQGELQGDGAGGQWLCTEGLKRIDPAPDEQELNVTVPLRRGMAFEGRVVGPQGQDVSSAMLLSHSYTRVSPRTSDVTLDYCWIRPVRDGRFKLRGCDPEKPQRVYFLDTENQWGAAVELDATVATTNAITVQLQPCGSVTARLVDAEGQPLTGRSLTKQAPPVFVDLVSVEGTVNRHYAYKSDLGWHLPAVSPETHGQLTTDDNGHVTFPLLIPGTQHKLVFGHPRVPLEDQQMDIVVEAGQNLELGDIPVTLPAFHR